MHGLLLESIAHFSITTPSDVTHIINVTCPDVSDKETVGATFHAAAAGCLRLKTVDFSSDYGRFFLFSQYISVGLMAVPNPYCNIEESETIVSHQWYKPLTVQHA